MKATPSKTKKRRKAGAADPEASAPSALDAATSAQARRMPAYALGRERTPGAPLLGAVAEHVTSGATGAPPAISPVTPGSVAQRQEAVQARQERDAASGDAVGSRGPGAPLSPAIRSQIEPRLGVDLGAGDRDCPSNGMKGGIRPAGSPADRRR